MWRRVTGWETRGVGTVSMLSLPDGVASPGAGCTAPMHFLWVISFDGVSSCSLMLFRYLAPTCDLSREGAAISAVCAFRPQDIQTVLNGPFRELKHDCNRGLPVLDNDVPQPRPGEVRGLRQLFTPCQNCLIRARAQLSITDTS